MTKEEKASFANSLYELLMISPETEKPLGFYAFGSDEQGNNVIGIGDEAGKEFWVLRVSMEEASKEEIDAI